MTTDQSTETETPDLSQTVADAEPVNDNGPAPEAAPEPEKQPTGVDLIDNLEQDCEHCVTALNGFFHEVARSLSLRLPSHEDHKDA